uniref:Uncharacterized protein n=1 Tax=mine drainage metagenome TaxID=410659 RepID=E6PH25_9ZZZZ
MTTGSLLLRSTEFPVFLSWQGEHHVKTQKIALASQCAAQGNGHRAYRAGPSNHHPR